MKNNSLLRREIAIAIFILFIGMNITHSNAIHLLEKSRLQKLYGTIIYVDDDNTEGPWDGTFEHPYRHIQDGIFWAQDGDTVFVFNGTYFETLTVQSRVDLIGEDRDTTIIDGEFTEDDIIYVPNWAYTISIEQFTIRNSLWGDGIRSDAHHLTISNNNIINTNFAIGLYGDYNNILNNNITNNNNGMWLYGSCHNTIKRNTIKNNKQEGFFLEGSSNRNDIIENNFIQNGYTGIIIFAANPGGNNNYFYHNNFIDNDLNAYDECDNNWYDSYFHSGGNFWDDYEGIDSNNDGIGSR